MRPPLRILVTGSRQWQGEALLRTKLHRAVTGHWNDPTRPVVLIHGGAPGADTVADRVWRDWMTRYRTFQEPEVHPADWATHGRAAGPMRNQLMVDLGAAVVCAFPIGDSPGTRDCIRRAEAAGIPVDITEGGGAVKHGNSAYRNGRCKCDICRASHNEMQKRLNERRKAARVLVDGRLVAPLPADRHGRLGTYANHGCQCVPCRQVGAAVSARNTARRRSAS